jgi:hypothetical protein
MPRPYQRPEYAQRLSTFLLGLRPGQRKALLMDARVPQGGINSDDLFGTTGSGTTDATAGTATAITHNLGVVPQAGEIMLTPTSNGVVYLDTNNPPTSTTFHVLGSAASLTFDWLIVTTLPHPSQEMV